MNSSLNTTQNKPLSKQLIHGKIKELFHYRQIPHLLKLSQIDNKTAFNSKLESLQLSIYMLDDYLERTWNLEEMELNRFWHQIDESLTKFGLTPSVIRDYCKQIDRYQSHEVSMRAGKWSTRYSIKYFYYYKSCDVKLLRRLIYMADTSLNRIIKQDDWNQYDLITEINDDLEDVFEDMDIFNANRFLVSLLQKGKRQTKSDYELFMKQEKKRINRKTSVSDSSAERQSLLKMTIERIDETMQLLHDQMLIIDIRFLRNALIAEKVIKRK